MRVVGAHAGRQAGPVCDLVGAESLAWAGLVGAVFPGIRPSGGWALERGSAAGYVELAVD